MTGKRRACCVASHSDEQTHGKAAELFCVAEGPLADVRQWRDCSGFHPTAIHRRRCRSEHHEPAQAEEKKALFIEA